MDKILKEHFDSFRDKGLLPPELHELNGKVKLFDNIELLKVWRNNLKGIQWKDESGNIYRGAVDNLLSKENKLIVLDYKTRGYPLKEDTHEHYQDQMDIYNLLLRKNNYDTEDFAYLLFYHPNRINPEGDVVFETDLIKIAINIKNAEEIFYNAVKILKNSLPTCNNHCEYCNWKKLQDKQ